ncbi:N-acetylmuramoyl-L-alanine amidase [Psychrobacillus glaciei]|uniref:N-acetylmuramoyl-L-alanine amidase n=1 Tax=Psychrobacillus glaciei TaxID=2283160 RepID=UPI001CEF9759|nr:N-acetylmuramoyl-L-alanine amidase [Psychrobacillus glaciei]
MPKDEKRYTSAHLFVDRTKALDLIPLDEVAFHANERKEGPLIPSLRATSSYYPGGNANLISIGIEMCVEKDGTIHPDTIARTVLVVQMLQHKFG